MARRLLPRIRLPNYLRIESRSGTMFERSPLSLFDSESTWRTEKCQSGISPEIAIRLDKAFGDGADT